MKVAVSLPTPLFEQAESSAARLGLNRSQLFARALEEFLLREEGDPVTARLDALADEIGGGYGRGAGQRIIDAGDWEW